MRLAIAAALLLGCQDSYVSRELGARCDNSDECDDRCLGPSSDWPAGFCTIRCETDTDCPEDAACIEEEGGVCAYACVADVGCTFLGNGYGCRERAARGGVGTRMVCRGS